MSDIVFIVNICKIFSKENILLEKPDVTMMERHMSGHKTTRADLSNVSDQIKYVDFWQKIAECSS